MRSSLRRVVFQMSSTFFGDIKMYVSHASLSCSGDETDTFKRQVLFTDYKVIRILKSEVNIGGRNSLTIKYANYFLVHEQNVPFEDPNNVSLLSSQHDMKHGKRMLWNVKHMF